MKVETDILNTNVSCFLLRNKSWSSHYQSKVFLLRSNDQLCLCRMATTCDN